MGFAIELEKGSLQWLRIAGEAEANIEAVAPRVEAAAMRDPAAPGIIKPAAAAIHTTSTLSWPLWVIPGIRRVVSVQIATPLKYISTHIVQSQ